MSKTKLSVIIPVYNESKTIKKILKKIEAVDLKKEIIIVDDGSTDGTREILKALKRNSVFNSNTKIVFHRKNKGKGSAIKTGLKYVKGNIVIIQDADLEYDPQDYLKLIQPVVDGKSKVVYGSRFKIAQKGRYSSLWFFLGGQLLTFLANLLYKTNITDEPTCYKVFDAQLLKSLNLNCQRFEFCPEVTAKIAKGGYKIHEVPIHYQPRHPSEGKKIKPRDGLVGAWILIKYRFFE